MPDGRDIPDPEFKIPTRYRSFTKRPTVSYKYTLLPLFFYSSILRFLQVWLQTIRDPVINEDRHHNTIRWSDLVTWWHHWCQMKATKRESMWGQCKWVDEYFSQGIPKPVFQHSHVYAYMNEIIPEPVNCIHLWTWGPANLSWIVLMLFVSCFMPGN